MPRRKPTPAPLPPLEKEGDPVTGETGLRSLWMDVTPEMARDWLERNFRNRPVSGEVIAAYARDMVNGVWVSTHQGIAFNDRDELIDGQHRLRAIVLAKRTIRMMVTFGLPSVIEGAEMTTMDAVDRGRTRSVADQLKIQHGLENGAVIAAVAANLGGLCFGERTRRLSVGQTLEIYRTFQEPIDWLIERRATGHGLKQAGVLAGFAFAIAAEIEGAAWGLRGFYEQLVGGEEIEAGRPLLALRNFLTSDEAKLLTRGMNRGVAELVLNALRLEINYQTVSVIPLENKGCEFFRAQQPGRVGKIAEIFQLPGA